MDRQMKRQLNAYLIKLTSAPVVLTSEEIDAAMAAKQKQLEAERKTARRQPEGG